MVAVPVIRLLASRKQKRQLAYSFWQYLLSRLQGDDLVPYLPDVIRTRINQLLELAHSQ